MKPGRIAKKCFILYVIRGRIIYKVIDRLYSKLLYSLAGVKWLLLRLTGFSFL